MYRLRFAFILLLNFGFLNLIYSQNEYGVWANENCELFRTKEFALIFERVDNRFIAKLFHFKVNENQYECNSYGEIQFLDTIQIVKRLDYQSDSLLMAKSIGILNGDSLIEISGVNEVQKLKLVERIYLIEPYEMKFAEKASVGICLQEWMLGTRLEMNKEKKSLGLVQGRIIIVICLTFRKISPIVVPQELNLVTKEHCSHKTLDCMMTGNIKWQ